MKKGMLLAFFLTIPLFSCAKITYYNVTVDTDNHCQCAYEKTAADNKDCVLTFTTDFSYELDPGLDDYFYVEVGGRGYAYVEDDETTWTFKDNVLTIKAKIITGDIHVHAFTELGQYKLTWTYGNHYLNHTSGDKKFAEVNIAVDPFHIDVEVESGYSFNKNNIQLNTINEHLNVNSWEIATDTLIIPSNQLGCDIDITLLDASSNV